MRPLRKTKSPIALVIRFLDGINHGDAEELGALMTEDHALCIFAEPPLVGRVRNVAAWRSYAASFPEYVIHPHRLAVRGNEVAVLGHTTGSHLGLPDEEESRLTLIWLARVEGDKIQEWRLIEDTPDHRREWGLDEV